MLYSTIIMDLQESWRIRFASNPLPSLPSLVHALSFNHSLEGNSYLCLSGIKREEKEKKKEGGRRRGEKNLALAQILVER